MASRPQAAYGRTGSRIDKLVYLAGHETSSHMDMRGIGHRSTVLQLGERPLAAGHDCLRAVLVVLNREKCVGVFQVVGGICHMNAVGEVLHLAGCVVLEGDHESAADSPLSRHGLRGVQAKHSPEHRGHRVASRTI